MFCAFRFHNKLLVYYCDARVVVVYAIPCTGHSYSCIGGINSQEDRCGALRSTHPSDVLNGTQERALMVTAIRSWAG